MCKMLYMNPAFTSQPRDSTVNILWADSIYSSLCLLTVPRNQSSRSPGVASLMSSPQPPPGPPPTRWLLSLTLRGRLRPGLLAPEAKVASMGAPQAARRRKAKQNKGESGHHVPFYYHAGSPERRLLQPTDAPQREVLRFHSNKVNIMTGVSRRYCIIVQK